MLRRQEGYDGKRLYSKHLMNASQFPCLLFTRTVVSASISTMASASP